PFPYSNVTQYPGLPNKSLWDLLCFHLICLLMYNLMDSKHFINMNGQKTTTGTGIASSDVWVHMLLLNMEIVYKDRHVNDLVLID
ncbi:hypothetical protein ACJX0J_040295, partial [Zea mays]